MEIHQVCYSSQTFYDSEQLKQQPFEEIFKKKHENLDTEEGESNEEEEKSTTSSEKSEQDSESGTSTEHEEESNPTETLQIHNVSNTITHDEENSSEAEDDTNRILSKSKILLVLYSCE